MAIQKWVESYRRLDLGTRLTIRNGLFTRLPEPQHQIVEELVKFGNSDKPLTLRDVHEILVRGESKFSRIEELIDTGCP